LPLGEKRFIQEAAVVGRIFWPGPLFATLDGSAASDSLRSLERRGMVTARPTSTIEGEPEYIFRHVLIRDVAYASVPKARRARAHAETGRWLEDLAGDRIEEFGELLAYHYGTAVAGEDADLAWAEAPEERESLRRRAFEVLIRAGAAARHRFAVDKAIALHQQALSIATDDGERARAHEAIGDDHESLFHMDEAVASYFTALDAARAAGDEVSALPRLAVRIATATARWGAFRQKPDADRIRGLVDAALRGQQDTRTRAALLIARSAMWRGADDQFGTLDPLTAEEALALVEEGVAIARDLDDVELMERGELVLAGRAYIAHQYEKERASAQRLADLVDRLPTRRQKATALEALAETLREDGQFRKALEAAERALEFASEVSAHERMHASATAMETALVLGRWDRVTELLPWHAEAAAQDPEVACPQVRAGPYLGAIAHALRGETDRARELAKPEITSSTRTTYFARSVLADYAAVIGETGIATELVDDLIADPKHDEIAEGFDRYVDALVRLGRRADVERAIPVARQLVDALAILGPVADRADAWLALEDGRRAEARPLLERALQRFMELEAPFEAAWTRELLAESSDGQERIVLLGDAWAEYERLGAKPSVERVRARLDSVEATA
jgi:tetratricopeptide (TPR) repeat protein